MWVDFCNQYFRKTKRKKQNIFVKICFYFNCSQNGGALSFTVKSR